MTSLLKYLQIVSIGFKELLAYRVTVYMITISTFVILFARYYLFEAIYTHKGQVIEGYSLETMLTYLVCAWLLRSFFRNGADRKMGRSIRNGNIVFDLIRPVNYFALTFCTSLGRSLNRLIFVALPLVAILFFTDIRINLPSESLRIFYFTLSVIIGYLIAFEFQFLVGLMAFFIGYNLNIIWTFELIIQILSGLILPLHFFPKAIAGVMMALPFRHIYYTPTEIFIGHLPLEQIPMMVFSGIIWMIGLAVLCVLLYKKAVDRLVIAGG